MTGCKPLTETLADFVKVNELLRDRIQVLRSALSEIRYRTDEQNTAGYCSRILSDDEERSND